MSKIRTANEEIRQVPLDWEVIESTINGQIYYYHPQLAPSGTYTHPTLGELPEYWQLHKTVSGYFYYNIITGQRTRQRPAYNLPLPLKPTSPSSSPPNVNGLAIPPPPALSPLDKAMRALAIRSNEIKGAKFPTAPEEAPATSVDVTVPLGFSKVQAGMNLKRNLIAKTSINHKYEIVKVIDIGDGKKGAMNAGIFVVRKKSTRELFVQKNFRCDDDFLISLVKKEIGIVRMLKCNSLVQFVDGFITDDPFECTMYMEYCDCGDLGQLLSVYERRKKSHLNNAEDYIPESFIWHTFLALMDGLHFLATGSSYLSVNLCRNDGKTWKPVIHRDIKPDNIMLKSRSTPGSRKPLYVILSDFGMAEHESDSMNSYPWPCFGTPQYHAPELCHDPYPVTEEQLGTMAAPHTHKSDVWAVATVVHAMCERDDLAHLDLSAYYQPWPKFRSRGRAARKQVLQITDLAVYSDRLQWAIRCAGEANPLKRPSARTLMPQLKTHMDRWRADPNWEAQSSVDCRLPDWAIKKSKLI